MATEYRIVVLGSGAVGKSALTIRYIDDRFLDKYDPTIEDTYVKQVELEIDGKQHAVLLNILDTAGQEEFSVMQEEYMQDGHGFILVYDITQPQSLEECKKIFKDLLKVKDIKNEKVKIPIVLVGNKSDREKDRAIPKDEGVKFSKEIGEESCKFFETSAKENINVKESFEELVKLINKIEGVMKEKSEEDDDDEEEEEATKKQSIEPVKKKKSCIIL